jgi:hypothetical protein
MGKLSDSPQHAKTMAELEGIFGDKGESSSDEDDTVIDFNSDPYGLAKRFTKDVYGNIHNKSIFQKIGKKVKGEIQYTFKHRKKQIALLGLSGVVTAVGVGTGFATYGASTAVILGVGAGVAVAGAVVQKGVTIGSNKINSMVNKKKAKTAISKIKGGKEGSNYTEVLATQSKVGLPKAIEHWLECEYQVKEFNRLISESQEPESCTELQELLKRIYKLQHHFESMERHIGPSLYLSQVVLANVAEAGPKVNNYLENFQKLVRAHIYSGDHSHCIVGEIKGHGGIGVCYRPSKNTKTKPYKPILFARSAEPPEESVLAQAIGKFQK